MGTGLFRRAQVKAFTLVELLVVVAILGVLMAMLLPSLQRAREAAQNGVCFSNMRQLSLAAVNYAVDRKDQTFWTRMWHDNFIYFRNSANEAVGCDARPWLKVLISDPRAFYCPRSRFNMNDPVLGWNGPTSGNPADLRITYSLVGFREPTPFAMTDLMTFTYPMRFTDLPAPAPNSTGNRPTRLNVMAQPSKIAVATDAQRPYVVSNVYSYPGYASSPWVDFPFDTVYPHRRPNNSWDGTTTAFYDGHAAYSRRESFTGVDNPTGPGAPFFRAFGMVPTPLPFWW